jgi:hypothetical protein
MTRDPASVVKTGGEIAFLTPVGMYAAYLIAKLDPTMPQEIQQAVVAMVIAGGSMLMSHMRNRKFLAG